MIIFPMLGNSSRFFEKGYLDPKYKLPLWGESVFYYCVMSFKKYFLSDLFIFIVRKNFFNSSKFVNIQAKLLGIKHFKIIELSEVSRGQAETVLLALKYLNLQRDEELFIFNIDTRVNVFNVIIQYLFFWQIQINFFNIDRSVYFYETYGFVMTFTESMLHT